MSKKKNVCKKADDYGTFFYKIRNGNLPFEYDIEKKLSKIEKLLERRNTDVISGITSAALANYISQSDIFKDNWLFFLFFLLIGFIILEGLAYIGKCIYKKMKKKKYNRISEEDDEAVQDWFYKKIIVQTTYVFSIIKRGKELANDDEKKDLCELYSMQGAYGIRIISVEIGRLIYSLSEKKLNRCFSVLGKESIIYTLDLLLKGLNEIKCIYPKAVRSSDEQRLNALIIFVNKKVLCIDESVKISV